MKSIKIFATVGAIALLGMTGFTSCNQKNGPVGPDNYNGEVVKTQFTISIPEAGNPNVAAAPGIYRMPATNTQDAGNFIGMDEIVLIPYALTDISSDVVSTSPRGGVNIELSNQGTGKTAGSGNITALDGDAKYKVYSDVSIPLNTNHFLFYAHGGNPATPQTGYSVAQSFEFGRLAVTGLGESTPASIHVNHVAIPTTDTNNEGTAIAQYLTSIANAKYTDGEGDHPWSGTDNADLLALYTKFTDLEAGSAASVLAVLEDLYNSLKIIDGAYKSQHEGTSNPYVLAIIDKIDDNVTISGTNIGAQELAWKTGDVAPVFANYPRSINLPDGAAAIDWDGSKFNVVTELSYSSLGVSNPASYVFPASLYYYVNSPLKTSTGIQSGSYNTYSTWDAIIANLYDQDDNGYVKSSTRSVAITKQIQYAVAELLTTVMTNATTLSDYGNKNTVTASNLTMTAVLVGGQGQVDFDFTTTATGDKIVYDKALASGTHTLGISPTTANPTLLLETKDAQSIFMAVEFFNDDQDFYGQGGKLIPKGTHFYVVAELTNANATPATGKAKRTKIFEQDYTTKVNLTLTNLSKAYNVVPDLRTIGLELGFSVDLSWQEGNTHNIEIN